MIKLLSLLSKIWTYIAAHPAEVWQALQSHLLYLVLIPVTIALLIGVPLGIIATRVRWVEKLTMGIASVLQTIPSLALLAFLILIGLGIGYKPSITALVLYSLLPVLRNTYTGIKNVDDFLKEAAMGMGMTNWQRLRLVELPLALSIIMAGVRTATVMCIGTGTLAAYIGAGGLGVYISRGLQLARNDLLLIGAVPAAILALLADFLLSRVETWLTPRGLRV